jgi:hypothetical protein
VLQQSPDAQHRGREERIGHHVEAARARQVDWRPGRLDITSTRSDRNTDSAIEWVIRNTVLPASAAMRASSTFILSRVMASSAPNGSSISRILGSCSRARAIAARWRMPPESSPGSLASKPIKPTRANSSLARAAHAFLSSRSTWPGSMTLASTVRHGIRLASWKTTPISGVGPCTMRPPTLTEPE